MTGFRAPRRLGVALVALAAWWADLGAVAAHPAYLTAAQVTVEPDGRFAAQFRFDLLAYALNDSSARIGNESMEALLAGPRDELEATLDQAKGRLKRGFRVVTDAGGGVVDTISFPDAGQVLEWRDQNNPVLPVVLPIRLAGRLPPGAKTVAYRFPAVLDQVILTVERPSEEPEAEAVDAGKTSTALPVRLEAGDAQASSGTASTGKSSQPPVSARLAADQPPGSVRGQLPGLVLFVVLGGAAFYVWWNRQRRSR